MEATIDLGGGIKKVWEHRRIFYKVLPIAFIVFSALILCVPRTYTASSKLAPESSSGMGSLSGLSSLASSFGFDLGGVSSEDAISPLFYPDLMEDNGFVMNLLSVRVRSCDGKVDATYHDYLETGQRFPWWAGIGKWMRKVMPKPKPVTVEGGGAETEASPYMVSMKEEAFLKQARSDIQLTVDKQTGIITIVTTAQDPLVAKMLADSTTLRLQHFITDYRTNKARVDLEYYERLTQEARQEYEEASKAFSQFSDANNDVLLQTVLSIQTDLENDMQMKYTTYSAMMTQLQTAKAKVQERTPAFTQLKGAQLPLKPSGPKRMLFVIGMLILTSFVCVLYILHDDIKGFFLKS